MIPLFRWTNVAMGVVLKGAILRMQAACRPFAGQNVAASRSSSFAGAQLSVKSARVASRKSAVAAQAKVSTCRAQHLAGALAGSAPLHPRTNPRNVHRSQSLVS